MWPVAIFCIALLQYVSTIGYDYAWDDKLVITGNSYTRQGIAGLPVIFTRMVSVPYKDVYRPLTQALFAIEYEFFPDNPHAGHFFSVLWYALLCVCVYRFIRFVFPGKPPAFAGLGALIYTIHPLHMEVVANIKSRDEILCFLFGLQGLTWLARWVDDRRIGHLALGLFCSLLSVLAKENGLTLLALLPLVVWYRSEKDKPLGSLFGLPPVPAIGGISLALAAGFYWFVHHIAGSAKPNALQLNSTVLNNIFLWTTDPAAIVPTALVNIGRYLLLFVYPKSLIHMYGYAQIPFSDWGSPALWGIIFLLAFCTYYLLRYWRRRSPAVFGMLFFMITYSVYSNLLVLAPDTMADRYLFMPSFGLAVIAANLFYRPAAVGVYWRKLALPLASCFILGCFIRGYLGNRDWENDHTLIVNRIRYMENNAAAQATYGQLLFVESMERGDRVVRDSLQRGSMAAFVKAVQIYPEFADAWISIGKIFAQLSIYDKAELAFLKAQQIQPVNPEGYFCLGSLNFTLGDLDRAIPYLQQAVVLAPLEESNYLILCRVYLIKQDMNHLALVAGKAVALFPQNPEFRNLLAQAVAPIPAVH